MNITTGKMQDRLNETVENTIEENQGMDMQEAEGISYDELKPRYLSHFISRYKYAVELPSALKKHPVNKRKSEYS